MLRNVGLRKSVEQPVLDLNFAAAGALDSRITFSRGTSATFVGSNGLIQTAGNSAARFDHDPVTNTPKGLLIEEARTNLVTDSEDFTGSQFNAVRVTNTANSSIAPDGTNTATEVVPSTDNNTHLIRWDDSVISGTTYTASLFVKQASGDANIRLIFNNTNSGFGFSAANFDLSAGTVNNLSCDSASIEAYGNGWFRCSVTEAATASVTGRIQLNVMDSSNNNSYAGDGTTGIFIWGFQIEEGSFPTSYIKTNGASATRNADVATMGPTNGKPFAEYNPSQGTVVCDFQTLSGLTRGPFHLHDDTSNTGLAVRVQSDAGTILDVITRDASNSNNVNISSIDLRSFTRVVAAYNSSGHARAGADGAKGTASGNTVTLSVDRLDIGTQTAGGSNTGTMSGHIRRLQYSTRFVSELEAQNLTSD